MLRNKLMTACCVAVLTAALYGCSSSSDDGANMQVQDLQDQIAALEAALGEGQELTPAALEALVSDLATANGMVMDLETMIGAETDPAAESLRGMLAQAKMDLMDANSKLQMAMDDAADETVIADLRQDVTDAETMRDNYKTMLDTAKADLVIVTGERDTARTDLAEFKTIASDLLAAGALKDRIARADKVQDAITAMDAKTIPNDDMSGVSAVTAKHNAAGMVTVDVNGAVDDDYAGGETNAGSSAWNSVVMTKTDADETSDTLVIYTDIEAPADVLFTKEYPAVTTNFLAVGVNVAKARSDNFPTGNGASLNYGEVDGTDSGNPLTFRGTFDDVPGVFACSVAGCTLTTNAKGELNGTAQEWDFTPDLANAATVKVPDASYTYFGWWLNKPEKSTVDHGVRVFAGAIAGASAAEPVAVTDVMEGTAKYSGPAAGKYVTKTFTAGVQTEAGVGHFTATTNLTARFLDDEGMGNISGTVTSFTLDDVTAVPWKVTLESADLTADAFTGDTEVNFGGGFTTTDPTDSEDMPAGTWGGSFYDAAPATPANGTPNTVIGTFDAATDDGNANVIGAFGAKK